MQKIIYRIDTPVADLFDKSDAECYVLNANLEESYCRQVIDKAAGVDKIILFYGENAVDVCLKYGADGVVVDFGAEKLKAQVENLRRTLGKGKFIGLFTRNRKHESMLVSEVEPDFVVFKVWKDGFENVKNLTDWYQEFFLIQSAAWLMEDGVDQEILKTDFIINVLE